MSKEPPSDPKSDLFKRPENVAPRPSGTRRTRNVGDLRNVRGNEVFDARTRSGRRSRSQTGSDTELTADNPRSDPKQKQEKAVVETPISGSDLEGASVSLAASIIETTSASNFGQDLLFKSQLTSTVLPRGRAEQLGSASDPEEEASPEARARPLFTRVTSPRRSAGPTAPDPPRLQSPESLNRDNMSATGDGATSGQNGGGGAGPTGANNGEQQTLPTLTAEQAQQATKLWVAKRDRKAAQDRIDAANAEAEERYNLPDSTMAKLVFTDKSLLYFDLDEGKTEEYKGLISQRGMLVEDIISKVKQLSTLRKKGTLKKYQLETLQMVCQEAENLSKGLKDQDSRIMVLVPETAQESYLKWSQGTANALKNELILCENLLLQN